MFGEQQLERIRDLAGDSGKVACDALLNLIGERSLTPHMLAALARDGISVTGLEGSEDSGGANALTLYMGEVTRHRLLAAHEERELARELDAGNQAWAAAVFHWPRARRELVGQALADPAGLASYIMLGDTDAQAVRARLQALAGRDAAASTPAALGAHRWQHAVVRPYAAELRYRYRLVQREETFVRNRCLMFAGVSRDLWATHAVDVFESGWIDTLVHAAALAPEVAAALAEQVQPARQRALHTVAQLDLDVATLRTIDRDIRRAEHAARRARHALIRANLRLVISVARRYQHHGVPLDDLIQEGNIGLMRAVDKFDWRLGYKLSTYATWWIRQAVGRAVQKGGRTVRLPGHVADLVRRVNLHTERLVQRLGRAPSAEELATGLGMDVARVREIQALALDAASIDDTDEDGWNPYATALTDANVPDPGEQAESGVMLAAVDQALAALPPTSALVVRLRYGLGTGEHSLVEIARQLGCTRARVRGLEREALEALRARFGDLDDWL